MASATITSISNHRATKTRPDLRPIAALKERFAAIVPPVLDAFFTAADDFLFRQAENRQTDSADYFEQLRVLRRRKTEFNAGLKKRMATWLDEGAGVRTSHFSSQSREQKTELRLLDDHSLERTLAIESFANRTFERGSEEWLSFQERMRFLLSQKHLATSGIPFNPAAVGSLLFEHIETLGLPFKTSLMLSRLLDEIVIPQLEKFYANSNIWLATEGILPDLKLVQPPSARSPLNRQTLDRITAALAGMEVPTAARQSRQGDVAATAVHTAISPASAANGILVEPAVWQQLLQSMASIQAQQAPAAEQITALKQWTVQQAQAISQQMQGTAEAGTVSFVALLFEYILDDANLSVHMKQLLARMQIPIIKVAMLDKNFFTNIDHPARTLLNQMAKAATGWQAEVDLADDRLLKGMEAIVVKLNRDFQDDIEIFVPLLAEFSALRQEYAAHQEQQIDEIRSEEEAALQAEEVPDPARLFLDTLLDELPLPESVLTLLNEHWHQLMSNIFATQGESKTWKTSARIARELVWSLQPNVQTAQPERFEKLVPKLLVGFAEGLNAVGLAASEIADRLTEIKNYHQLYRQEPDASAADDTQIDFTDFQAQVDSAARVIDEPPQLSINEPIIKIRNADLSYYLDQVESLTLDQWFEIVQADGISQRGKLSIILGEGRKYIFTDFNGVKIAERSAIGLAMSMRNEQFNLIADDPLLDRMIDTLIEDLGDRAKAS